MEECFGVRARGKNHYFHAPSVGECRTWVGVLKTARTSTVAQGKKVAQAPPAFDEQPPQQGVGYAPGGGYSGGYGPSYGGPGLAGQHQGGPYQQQQQPNYYQQQPHQHQQHGYPQIRPVYEQPVGVQTINPVQQGNPYNVPGERYMPGEQFMPGQQYMSGQQHMSGGQYSP